MGYNTSTDYLKGGVRVACKNCCDPYNMKMNDSLEVSKKQIPIVSLLLGIAVIATTTAYVLYRYSSDKAYRKKWKDYDECGLA